MDPKNYYKILGVPHDASQQQINHAYRELAKKWHPDINHAPNAGKMFTKINQAYSVLGNKKKREAYDQFGSSDASTAGAGFGNGAGFNNFSGFGNNGFDGNAGFGDFNDIFNSFFNGGQSQHNQNRASMPHRGRDLQYNMHLSFSQAIFGEQTTLSYNRVATCPACHGVGGSEPETCPTCHGTGYTIVMANTPMGRTEIRRTCPTCHGAGKTVKNRCSRCNGTGHVNIKHELSVEIPAGVTTGEKMRLQNQGNAGTNGGSYGDLYIIFSVSPDKNFTRHGSDVYTNQNISVSQATLGGQVTVHALDYKKKSTHGAVSLKIPSGTQSGTVFRLKGLGIHSPSQRGDEKVRVHIAVPNHLNHRQRQAMLDFAKASGEDGHDGGVFSRMRNAFKK